MTKLIVINGILSYSDGTQVPDEVWAVWQQERVADWIARQDAADRETGYDRRIGAGITWNRASRTR